MVWEDQKVYSEVQNGCEQTNSVQNRDAPVEMEYAGGCGEIKKIVVSQLICFLYTDFNCTCNEKYIDRSAIGRDRMSFHPE